MQSYFMLAEPTKFVEQDWLNSALGFTHTVLLPPIYNVQRGCRDLPDGLAEYVKVCHCTGNGQTKITCMKTILQTRSHANK